MGARLQISFRRVATAADLNAALDAERWDAIISDYVMPSFDAPTALRIVRQRELDTPFIIVSGSVGEEIAVQPLLTG